MARLIVLGLLCCFAGCGGSGGTTVQGKVTFSDGSPLPKGVVSYIGKTGTFRGAINADGTYELKEVQKGDYQVTITGAEDKTGGGEIQYDDKGNYIAPPPEKVTRLISESYSDPEQSGLTKTVPGDYAIQVDKP